MFKAFQKESRRQGPLQNNYEFSLITDDEKKLDARFLQDYIDGIVEKMPEKYSIVFRYSRELGLKNAEIAETVNISEKGVDDWCVAQLAKKLNKASDYQHFMQRSQNFRNLYDTQSGFFRARDSEGKWASPFNPLQYGGNGGNPYTEGNAWQYYWYVPQDIKGLITLTGGNSKFIAKLDTFFTLNSKPGEVNGNASGFIGQYAHGNEPSPHFSYLYDYAGQPWKTQFYVAKILNELYNTSSSGYAGNEDCGQMSAWYVFSAMGFYPVNPASGVYAIGTPLLRKSVIKLSANKQFIVLAPNSSAPKICIYS